MRDAVWHFATRIRTIAHRRSKNLNISRLTISTRFLATPRGYLRWSCCQRYAHISPTHRGRGYCTSCCFRMRRGTLLSMCMCVTERSRTIWVSSRRPRARPTQPNPVRELAGAGLDRQAGPDGTVTILFTDIADSTGMTEKLGDLRAQEILHA